MRPNFAPRAVAAACAIGLSIPICLLTASAATAAAIDPAQRPDLAAQVRQSITMRLPDNAAALQIQARGNTITLAGEVDLLAKREIAGEVAERVRGVTHVENRISVRPEERPDESVAIEVINALKSERVTAAENIDVSVEDGVVSLRGLVNKVAQKSLAGWIASHQRGVRDVRNELRVTPVTKADEDLRAELTGLFTRNPVYSDNTLSVAVSRGAVVITGTVDTLWEKRRAERDAWLPGVLHVDTSHLRVIDRQPTGRTQTRSPDEIARDFRTGAASNAALANNRLTPKIKDGHVVLTGEVDSYFEKTVAEDLARHIAGVIEVTNRLAIKGVDFAERVEHYHAPPGWNAQPIMNTPGRPLEEADAKLKAQVKRALAADPRLYGENIEVSVERGVVTLGGPIGTAVKQTAAVEIARAAGAHAVKPEFEPGLRR